MIFRQRQLNAFFEKPACNLHDDVNIAFVFNVFAMDSLILVYVAPINKWTGLINRERMTLVWRAEQRN